jgi:hypothetical protein
MNGSNISAVLDGSTVISGTDSNISTAGSAGVRGGFYAANSALFLEADNFKVI